MLKVTCLSLILLFQANCLLGAPEIQLPNGIIRGREGTTINNKQYYIFGGIPYAAPPVGELRFQAPVPPENWEEPLDTPDLVVSCYQRSVYDDYQTEDCLYLAVFTPELNASLPVMVYIHGGGFVAGSGRYTYSDPIVEEGVIFVAINYRLGPWGFISSGDEVIPGNNGLKDQLLALKWIHDNIQLFGGDPDKITIFGTSAGSASCAYHLLNQESTGLFRGVILESGTFLTPWAYQRNAREIAFGTAAIINATFETNRDSNDLLQFLQTVDNEDFNKAQEQYMVAESSSENVELLQGFFWAPVIEVKNPNAFLTKKMYGLLQAGSVVPVPIVIGMTSEEALAFSQDPSGVAWNNGNWDEHLAWLVPNDMGVTDEAQRTEIGSKIRDIYTGGEPLADHLGDGVRYYSDSGFTRSIIKTAEIYSQLAETYFYQFSYDGSLGHLDVSYDNAEHVGHSQENIYIFCGGTGCDISGYPESDQVTRNRLIKLWTNFAKYQNPTPEPSDLLQSITWPVVSTEGGDFLYLDIAENLEIKNHPKEATYGKWIELYDSLEYSDFDTY